MRTLEEQTYGIAVVLPAGDGFEELAGSPRIDTRTFFCQTPTFASQTFLRRKLMKIVTVTRTEFEGQPEGFRSFFHGTLPDGRHAVVLLSKDARAYGDLERASYYRVYVGTPEQLDEITVTHALTYRGKSVMLHCGIERRLCVPLVRAADDPLPDPNSPNAARLERDPIQVLKTAVFPPVPDQK
ncbi:MAG: hypothetical protein WC866_04725 [Patescibacteria group bacterium]|jgi:hypothetical protein